MDKNYLKFFCLCFKCLEFFYKKIYIWKSCLDNLITNTAFVTLSYSLFLWITQGQSELVWTIRVYIKGSLKRHLLVDKQITIMQFNDLLEEKMNFPHHRYNFKYACKFMDMTLITLKNPYYEYSKFQRKLNRC